MTAAAAGRPAVSRVDADADQEPDVVSGDGRRRRRRCRRRRFGKNAFAHWKGDRPQAEQEFEWQFFRASSKRKGNAS